MSKLKKGCFLFLALFPLAKSLVLLDHIKYAGMFLETNISIEFNDEDSNNLAGYEERTRVLYMILKY